MAFNSGTISIGDATEKSDYDRLMANTVYNKAQADALLKTKVVDIGDWNMASSTTVNVTHGLTVTSIKSVSAMIRADGDATRAPLNTFNDNTDPAMVGGGVNNINATVISLYRRTGGFFDGSSYNSTSYNRGWVTIVYEA